MIFLGFFLFFSITVIAALSVLLYTLLYTYIYKIYAKKYCEYFLHLNRCHIAGQPSCINLYSHKQYIKTHFPL